MVLERRVRLRVRVVAACLDVFPPWRLPLVGGQAYDSAQQRHLVVTDLAEPRPQYVNVVMVAGGRKDLLWVPVVHESGIVFQLLEGVCPSWPLVDFFAIVWSFMLVCVLCALWHEWWQL